MKLSNPTSTRREQRSPVNKVTGYTLKIRNVRGGGNPIWHQEEMAHSELSRR